jgi:hypothetical protein
LAKVEQGSRKSPQGQLATDETAAIPAPRRPAVGSLPDDEVDSDAPATAEAEAEEGLSQRERDILAFERQSWRHAGSKEQAIRDRFELSGTRYYQLLNALLDNPAALAHDPVLVGRLRRLRGSRARARGR